MSIFLLDLVPVNSNRFGTGIYYEPWHFQPRLNFDFVSFGENEIIIPFKIFSVLSVSWMRPTKKKRKYRDGKGDFCVYRYLDHDRLISFLGLFIQYPQIPESDKFKKGDQTANKDLGAQMLRIPFSHSVTAASPIFHYQNAEPTGSGIQWQYGNPSRYQDNAGCPTSQKAVFQQSFKRSYWDG